MGDPTPALNLSPTARAAVDAVAAASCTPVKLLITGGVGSGKTTVLLAIRDALRRAGTTVLARLPQPGDPADAAVVIDDTHLLDPADVDRLTQLAGAPGAAMVVATEPRDHDPALSALATAIEREQPRIALTPFPSGEIARLLTDPAGQPPSGERVNGILAATAGIALLVAAATAAQPTPAAEAVRLALIQRLRRLPEAELDALLIASLSSDLGATDIAAALDLPAERAQTLIDRVRGTGLVEPSHSPDFLRSVHLATAQIAGNARHHEVESALLRSQIAMSTMSPALAVRLAEHGIRDPRLAELLRDRIAAGHDDPAGAARLYRAAVHAGADELRPQLADALTRSGDYAAAATLADDLLGAGAAERAAGVRVAASLAVHNGNSAQAAELFSWLGPYPDAALGAAAAIVLTGSGDAAGARRALDADNPGPPTTASRAARALADGLLATLDTPYPVAAATLGQAMAADDPAAQAMPDSPAALVTLAALHGGDPVRARHVIARAVAAGADPLFGPRHRLLLAWTKMQDGRLTAAAADLAAVDDSTLRRRDALWAGALRTAIARRGGDAGATQQHWFAAMDVLAEYSVDLFSLLPLGELWMAAARMRQRDRITPALDQAFAVLAGLGDPVSWSMPLHWAGVHAGILAGDPAAVRPHGQALTSAAARSPFAAALAEAGRTWLRVLAGQVEPDEVAAAARGLATFGLTSDATRLAGQAALQAADPRVSGLMLQVARDLRPTAADAAPAALPTGDRATAMALSDREREVAELLLLGMPYRDIGGQLFISAKTVEHHVARIRRRLGAESRAEMLSMLRAILTPEPTAPASAQRG